MGRPINNKHFGAGAGKYAVKFYDGSSVVTGLIAKQVGSKKFKVTKSDGTGAKICRLCQTTTEVTALTAGTGPDAALRAQLCTIEATPFGGGVENVKSITAFRLVTVQGTKIKHKLAQGATTGFAVPAAVAQIAITVANAIPDGVGTVAGAYSYVIPANTFAGGNGTLTYSMTPVTGFSFNATTRTVSKAAGASSVGAKNITITVTDADGTTQSDTYAVTLS